MKYPNFWLGCFQQPKESFKKYADEGINLVVQPAQSNGDTIQDRVKAAADAGLWVIDVPTDLATLEFLVASPNVYAVCLPDEISELQPWYGGPSASASQAFVSAKLAQWKPIFDQVKNRKPIWANFGSNRITSGRPSYSGEMLLPYVKGCNVTEVSFDDYPVNTAGKISTYPTNDYNGGKDPLLVPGDNDQQFAYRVLQNFCPGLPIWAYLETTEINPNVLRSPTGAEVLQEANTLIKMGVKGLIYFTHSFGNAGGWNASAPAGASMWDGRNPDVVTVCKNLASVLNGSAIVPPPPPPVDLTSRVTAIEAVLSKMKAALS